VVIDVSSFNDVHRLGVKRPGQNRQIIVRFMNRTLKIKFLSGRKNLKNTDYKNVFINEDLTKLQSFINRKPKNTMTRISKRVINVNIFTKEISHKTQIPPDLALQF
jgi:hypothetical protein